jgi:hypothetical protein
LKVSNESGKGYGSDRFLFLCIEEYLSDTNKFEQLEFSFYVAIRTGKSDIFYKIPLVVNIF